MVTYKLRDRVTTQDGLKVKLSNSKEVLKVVMSQDSITSEQRSVFTLTEPFKKKKSVVFCIQDNIPDYMPLKFRSDFLFPKHNHHTGAKTANPLIAIFILLIFGC